MSTPPTPAMMPSHTREMSTGDTPSPARVGASHRARASIPAPTPSDSQEPKGPKVTTNITSMVHRNRGMAKIRWVTTLSIFSLKVSSPGTPPRTTEADTTFWIY